jgi:hypothetical protein
MHRRTTALIATTLLGATLLPAASATGAAPTCRGQAVTIDGTGAALVVGTEGADVIYSTTAAEVVALGGDDLICIAAGHGDPLVKAGAGNDVVDATAATGTTTVLGEGDDTFHGSAAQDTVTAGTMPYEDTGTDVIATGPRSHLRDIVDTGQPGLPNADDVRGDHVDVEWHGAAAGSGVLDGGADSLLRLQPESWGMSINTDLGVLAAARWPSNQAISGFTDFSVTSRPGLTHFSFVGSTRDENLVVDGLRKKVLFQVALGNGDDELAVVSSGTTHRNASFSGGRGTDRLDLVMPKVSDVDLDLRRGRLSTGRGRGEENVAARGFEDATVVAPDIEVVGTTSANDISVDACRATVEGLRGRDTIAAIVTSGSNAGTLRCRDGRHVRFLGGGGADRLLGSGGPDLLVGGPGRDRADGGRGRDTCRAEVRKNCEVRR